MVAGATGNKTGNNGRRSQGGSLVLETSMAGIVAPTPDKMGYKDKDKQRAYQRRWMANRRNEWLLVNGPCSCGSWDKLEVDHIDPTTKLLNPSAVWSLKKEHRDKELAKCQALCYDCHIEKTREQLSGTTHGTYAMRNKYGCTCDECLAYVRDSKREWRAKQKV